MHYIKMFILIGLSLAFRWRLDDLFRSYSYGHDDLRFAKFRENAVS